MNELKNDYGKKIVNWGVLFFALTGPWTIFGAEMGIVLVVLGWIFRRIQNRDLKWQHSLLDLPILVYLVIRVLSSIIAIAPLASLRLLLDTEWPIFLYFAMTNNIDDLSLIKKSIDSLIWLSTLVALYAIQQHFYGYDYIRHQNLSSMGKYYRALGNFGFYLTFGGYQASVFLVALATFLGLEGKKEKIIRFLQLLLIFLSVVATYARSAWLGVIGGGALLILFSLSRKKFFTVIMGIIIFGVGITFLVPEIGERAASIFSSEANIERIKIYESCINIIKAYPLLGVGEGNFKIYFEIYKVPFHYLVFSPHNDFLNVAINSGLLGLFSFLGVWGFFLYSGIQFFRNKIVDTYYRHLALGSSLGILSFLIGGFFQGYYTDLEDSMLWWFLAGVAMVTIRQAKKSHS